MRAAWLHRWVYYLTTGFMFAAAALRALLLFKTSPILDKILLLLAAWLIAYVASMFLARNWPLLSALLISLEVAATLVLVLLTQADFFIFLFAIPCMQAMQSFNTRVAPVLVGITTLIALFILIPSGGVLFAFGMAVVYFGGTALLVAYISSTRRASRIEAEQHELVTDVQRANSRLEATARQLERLAADRERQRLARELHDSVTQTLYSMTLTTQSALLLLDRAPQQVASQLERLDELTQSALSEMQVLISKLAPERSAGGGLVAYLQQHLEERRRLENLSIRLEVEGSYALQPMEEASLFRIAQEALNNIVKHAQVSEGVMRLHLHEPCWMEIEDRGIGLDPQSVHGNGGLGLTSMRERAAEIGWTFKMVSAPGNGTRVRVEKAPEEESSHELNRH